MYKGRIGMFIDCYYYYLLYWFMFLLFNRVNISIVIVLMYRGRDRDRIDCIDSIYFKIPGKRKSFKI